MKPSTRYNTGPNGYEREYVGQIDFRDGVSGGWQVSTVMPVRDKSDAFVDGMWKNFIVRDYTFDVETLPGKRKFVTTFIPHKANCRRARRNLLRFLDSMGAPIIWKECRHGYEINKSGLILRKWTLKQPDKTFHLTP